MADDIANALQQANRSASVLQGIANPPQINPLAAITAGNQAAQSEFQTQRDQINTASARMSLLATHAMTIARDPSDANVNAVFDNLGASGMPPDFVARERARWLSMPETERQNNAVRAGMFHLDQLRQNIGETTLQPYGDVQLPTTLYQPTARSAGGMTVAPGRTMGPPPGTTGTQFLPYDEQGEIPIIKGVPSRTPKYWQPSLAPLTAVPGINPGGQPFVPPPSGGGGGAPSVTQPPPPPGNTVRPSAPPPAVAPGPQGSLQTRGGVPVASANPDMVPTTGTPGPPSPAVAGDVAAIRQGMAGAAVNPRPPGTQTAADTRPPFFTQPPQGQPEKLKSDSEIYAADQKAQPQIMTQAQNLGHAYDALSVLKSNTGKGAAGLQALRSFAGTLGITSAATMNEQKLVEVINKYTERAMIDAAGGAATDMGRRMAESSNPGTTLGNAANFELMRNDMGKTLQNAAAYQDWAKAHPGDIGGGYPEQRAAHAARTDPRGFVWSMYDDDEKAKINAEVAKNQDKADALHRAIGIADRLKLHPPVTVSPPPRKQSFVAPPMPQQNALTMAG